MTLKKNFTIFSGHFGCGKTSIAINYALTLSKISNSRITLYDLDIINPYFRATDSIKQLKDAGVKLISSQHANTNAEGNPLPSDVMSAFDNPGDYEVFDIGGDDVGALALARYGKWLSNVDVDLLLVVNKMRPLCSTVSTAYENMRAIERTAGLKFTGIVNNTNLGKETTKEIIINSLPYANELSDLTGLPIVFTTIKRDLEPELSNIIENICPIDIFEKPGWAVY